MSQQLTETQIARRQDELVLDGLVIALDAILRDNERLAIAIYLPENVRLYVPDVDGQQSTAIDVETKFSEWFGGCTSYAAAGKWFGNGQLYVDKITIVESFTDEITLINQLDDVINLCNKIKIDLGEESIALEINRSLYLL